MAMLRLGRSYIDHNKGYGQYWHKRHMSQWHSSILFVVPKEKTISLHDLIMETHRKIKFLYMRRLATRESDSVIIYYPCVV